MRLTKDIRKKIVAAIMANIPKKPWGQEFLGVCETAFVKHMPKKLLQVYRDKELRPALATTSWYSANKGLPNVPMLQAMDCHKTFKELWIQLHAIRDKYEALHSAQKAETSRAENAVKQALDSCNTADQVVKLFPEFTKYMPEESAISNLPMVTDTVSTLMAVGWPKGKPVAQKKKPV